ncbi:SLAC1 anion channel family protein [Paenibacillus lignilyticus]|uniref:SLAC1 anion channel family protein n=1 Tax=Paenibacillus lignilyticus TaxID=1172615 RepID=A0ABS5CB17_9BACL|nr:SLAC1 anion channel family protein [Paenibacillus lignilyticus]MBP3963124.1 SLAC1 anion channel family protein [Paenibacillus lignilyticus]
MHAMTDVPQQKGIGSVQFLPVSLFASVMGISGLSLAWRQASKLFGSSTVIADCIGVLAILIFVALSAGYLSKWLLYPNKVKAEFVHPITGNFFGTITIALLLLSSVIGFYSQAAGQVIWIIGTILTLALCFVIVTRLLNGNHEPGHVVPPWLIPGVGTIDIAVAGGTMPFPWAHEINLLSLAIGGIVALLFLTLILSRLIHHAPLPAGLVPSMIIMIAPFEVGFLGYTKFQQKIDPFASILFYFGLFLFIVLFFKVFRKSNPFSASWWAVSFPIAALSNAALEYAIFVHSWLLTGISAIVLAFLSIVLLVFLIRTMNLLFSGNLLKG